MNDEAKVVLSLCNSAYKELRSIKRESNKIDQYDLHHRIDWVMSRVEYAIEYLESNEVAA